MTVAMKPPDEKAIRKLIPLTKLSADVFEKLCAEIQIEEGPKGTVLFRQGDQKNEFVYLLKGTISLQAAGMEMDTITGGAEAARFALAHQIPRKVFAVAKNKVRFVRIKAELLNASTVEKKSSQSYEVSDMPEEESGDWMTTLLQSPIFQQLPAANLQKVLRSMEEVEVKTGEKVVSQGESGDFYYIIKKGRCTLTRKPSPNAKEIKLGQLQTTDTFGEDSLISGEPRNVNISMLTDGVLLRLDKKNFLNLIKEPVIQHVDITQAIDEYKHGCLLLDVRTPDIFEQGHIKGSTNIPFFSLRMQMGNLDPTVKNIVICEDGNTSEAATFQLIRHGLQAVVLDGGFNKVPEEFLDAQPQQSSTKVAQEKLGNAKESETKSPPVASQAQGADKTVPAADQALADAQSIIAQLQKQLKTEKDKRLSAEQGNASVASDQAEHAKLQQQLEHKIAGLEKSTEKAQKEASDLKTQLDAASLQLTSAQRAQANTDSDSEKQQLSLKNQLDAAKSEINTQTHKLEQTTSDLKAASDELESLRQEYDTQKKGLAELEKTLSDNRTTLDKENTAKKVTDANLSRIKTESSDKITQLRQELEGAKNKQSSFEESIGKLEKALSDKNASYELLSKQKQELENAQNGKLETLLAEKQAVEKEVTDFKAKLERALVDKDKGTGGTAHQIEKLETGLKAANELLKKQKTDSETTIAALNEELSKNREAYDDLNNQKKILESEQSSRIDSLLAEKQALDKEVADVNTLSKERDDIKTSRDKLESENLALASELEGKDKEARISREQLDDALKKHFATQDELSALTELHEQSVEKASNEHSKFSEKISEIQQQLDSSNTEFDSIQNELQTVSEARDALEQNKNQLEQETLSLRQNVENIDKITAELSDLQISSEQQRDEFEQQKESYKLKVIEEQEKQAALKDEVATFTAEASELQERLANKTQDLSDLESKLFAIRKENAILKRNTEEMAGGNTDPSSTSQLNELRSTIGDLEEKHSIAQKEKSQARDQINELLEQNTELKSVVQEFMDQAANKGSDSDPKALQAELKMVRDQAGQDVAAIQKQLTDSENETERLRRELQAERQRATDLEEATNSPLSINSVFKPVDQDVFSMIDEDTKKPKSPQTKKARSGGRKFIRAIAAGLFSTAIMVGLALGTEQGRDLLITFLISESLQDMQSKYPQILPETESINKLASKLGSQNPKNTRRKKGK